jgi:hypothetical protein
MDSISKEILQQSYWEHFKAAKDLALYLEPTHPKRVKLEKVINEISNKLNENN